MKILILANDSRGLYKFRKELLKTMLCRGDEVYISLPDGEFIDTLQQFGCRYIETRVDRRGMNPLKDIGTMAGYFHKISGIKPDMIMTYTIKPNIYGGIASAFLHTPYIVNITGMGTAVEKKGALQLLTKTLYRFALRKAKCVFFQNSGNKDFFVKNNLIRNRYRLVPGSGVNVDENQAMPYPDTGTVHFLFVARIFKEKGIELYLNAAKAVHARHSRTMFHICGSYEDTGYKSVVAEAEREGYVQYHGQQKDMTPFYRMANCIVHPSYYPEGMSNVLLEASAHARPVITTDRDGCREVVEEGKNGYIVPVRNEHALIEAIEKFLELSGDEQRVMGLNGRAKMEREFNRQIVTDAYMEEIHNTGD